MSAWQWVVSVLAVVFAVECAGFLLLLACAVWAERREARAVVAEARRVLDEDAA